MFTYFWSFLELFIEKFILNINNEHAQDYSCPRATFAFCSHGEKLPRQGGWPGVVQRVTRLSKLPRGNEKLMWTVTGVRPCTEAKLTPGSVSCPGAMSCPGIMWTGPKNLFTWTRDSELPWGKCYLAFTWWFIVPGQCCSGQLHCPGASSSSSDHYELIWNSFSFCTNCYREWILNTFTYFWCFLELLIGKFIPNINNEHAQDYFCPRANFAFRSHGEKLPRQDGLPSVVQQVTRLSKLPRGNEKLMWTVTGVRPCTEAKLTLGPIHVIPGQFIAPGQVTDPGVNFASVRALTPVTGHMSFSRQLREAGYPLYNIR